MVGIQTTLLRKVELQGSEFKGVLHIEHLRQEKVFESRMESDCVPKIAPENSDALFKGRSELCFVKRQKKQR